VKTEPLPRSFRSFGVRGKCAGNQLDLSIEPCRHLVNRADSSATDNTHF
jgi:hypothetical protein